MQTKYILISSQYFIKVIIITIINYIFFQQFLA